MTLSLTKSLQTMQKTCSVCGCLISSVYYTLDSGEVVCERDYLKTLDQCRKCGQPVHGKLVKLSGSSYHPECFSCQVIIIFNLIQENNIEEISKIVEEVIENNSEVLERIANGEEKLIGFLVGQIIKISKGQVNPSVAKELLLKEISS